MNKRRVCCCHSNETKSVDALQLVKSACPSFPRSGWTVTPQPEPIEWPTSCREASQACRKSEERSSGLPIYSCHLSNASDEEPATNWNAFCLQGIFLQIHFMYLLLLLFSLYSCYIIQAGSHLYISFNSYILLLIIKIVKKNFFPMSFIFTSIYIIITFDRMYWCKKKILFIILIFFLFCMYFF